MSATPASPVNWSTTSSATLWASRRVCAVGSSIKVPGVYIAAIPAMPFKQWRQMFSALRRLPGLEARVRRFEAGASEAPETGLPETGEERR